MALRLNLFFHLASALVTHCKLHAYHYFDKNICKIFTCNSICENFCDYDVEILKGKKFLEIYLNSHEY